MMTKSNGSFENVLLKLWRELPHDIMAGREKCLETIETLKRWGIPLGVPEEAITGAFAISEFLAREYATTRWAWAIPDEKAIEVLVRHSPIVEIGAGTGYWARLVADAGADIVAYDLMPPVPGKKSKVRWDESVGTCFPVRRGGPSMVRHHQHRTLFLCWPPHQNDMAAHCLGRYEGETVIYVGELGGCTANEWFHEQLEREWEIEQVVAIPQWYGLHDRMFMFRRKGKDR